MKEKVQFSRTGIARRGSGLPVPMSVILTRDMILKVSRPSNTRSTFGADISQSLASKDALKAQSASPIPKDSQTGGSSDTKYYYKRGEQTDVHCTFHSWSPRNYHK